MKGKKEEFWGYFIIFIIKLTIYHSIFFLQSYLHGYKCKNKYFPFNSLWKPNKGKNLFSFLSFPHPNTHSGKHFVFSFSFPWCFLSYSLSVDATKHKLNEHNSRHPPIAVVMTPSMPHLEKMEEILIVRSNDLFIHSYQKLPRKDVREILRDFYVWYFDIKWAKLSIERVLVSTTPVPFFT